MTQEVPELATYVGRDDLLSRALGVPEYDGRVRGTGFGVTQTTYFGRQKRPNKSDFLQLREEMNCFKHQMQEQMQEQFEAQMRLLQEQNAQLRAQIDQLVQSKAIPNVPPCDSPSVRDSCTSIPKVQLPLVINFFSNYLLHYLLVSNILSLTDLSFTGRGSVQVIC